MEEYEIKNVTIGKIKFDGANPNIVTKDQMRAMRNSMEKFGYLAPVILDQDLVVADGEHRVQIYKEVGRKTIPAYIVKCTAAERKILRQTMNKLRGTHDPILDAGEFKKIFEAQGSFDDLKKYLNYSDQDIDKLMKNLPEFEYKDKEEEFDAESEAEKIETPQTKLGDIYVLGNHRLSCGDCTKQEYVLPLMDGRQPDITITDPPYNIGKKYTEKTDDNKTFDEYKRWTKQWTDLSPDRMIFTVGIHNLLKWDTWFKEPQWIIAWIKRNGQSGTRLQGTNKWDAILLYNVKPDKGIDILDISNEYNEGLVKLHPTARPIALYVALINRFTTGDCTVYEPFGGTGTTLIACEKVGRTCYIIEIDPVYCDVIVKRWETFTGKKAVKLK